ncbi:hypothetical protein BS047_RS01885, partial [Vibrio parahaemolyticus]|nr:hypothetical protein [Vibrio parahaemolyticus]
HETYPESGLIADDASNERIQDILRDFGIDENSDQIEEKFGQHGLDIIRQAEQGSYEYEDLQQKPENKSNSKSRRRNRP